MKRIFGILAMMAAFSALPGSAEAAINQPDLNKKSVDKTRNGARSARKLTGQQTHLIRRFIEEAAAKERLEPALIRSVIAVESAFNYKAISRVGARGLMQIMPGTAMELGEKRALDHTNPRANILAGSRLLRKLVNRYQGNLVLALAAYNAGPEAVRRYAGVPPYPETRDYVRKVLGKLQQERVRVID